MMQLSCFAGTKKQAADAVKEEAERAGQYYINHRWLGEHLQTGKRFKNVLLVKR